MVEIIDLDENPENADWLHQNRKRKEAKMIKYFEYLDGLRESGITNMFGASAYLEQQFSELTQKEAQQILANWMTTFSERHPKKEEENSGQERD